MPFRRHLSRLLCLVPGGVLLLTLFFALPVAQAADSTPQPSPVSAPAPAQQTEPAGPANGGGEEVQQLLQHRLEQLYFEIDNAIGDQPVYTSGYLFDLYRRNQFNPLWTNEDNIAQLLAAIAASADEGLIPDDYHLTALSHYRGKMQHQPSPVKLVEYDLLLSDAMVLLGHHKRYGKVDPRKVEDKKNLEANTPRLSPVDTYLQAIRTGTVRTTLEKMSPHHPSYRDLKDALSRYKKIGGKGGWHKVPAGPSIKPGMTDPRVVAIRHRLGISGEYHPKGSGESQLYDNHIAAAVKAFQARHHIEPDGVVGNATLAAMNTTVNDRIHQIRVNLERTRWVIHDLPSSNLIVDIAGFSLQYYHDNKPVWTSKVMVGKPYHQTPVFRSAITYIVLNPTWTPTPDIVKNETVPSIIKDPDFLAKQRMRVLDSSGNQVDPNSIPWRQYQGRYLPYTLRQDPGVDNSLGLIKFLFPNPYHVYLHDTPSKSLFGRTNRAFSHGCIRVQNPLDLGRMILANDAGNPTSAERMNQILASGRTSTVILKQPLPVYLMYLTTKVQDGKVMFKPDMYNRDAGVLAALNGPPSPLEYSTPEVKGGPAANQQVRVDKTIKLVQTRQESKPVDPNAQDSL